MKKYVGLIMLALLLGCEEQFNDAEALGANAEIVGTWVEEGHEEDVIIMLRADELDPTRYGFTLHEDGTFTERKNANSLDSAPVAYNNYAGSWEALSDSLVEITVGYWGGSMTYQIRIVSLDFHELRIRYLYTEDRAQSR